MALSIYQLPGSNALDTADGVYAKMKELKTRFPDGLDYQIVYDTTPFIRESVNEVFNTLRDAVILVAIVVLVFLQDWRAMILPMIDVPVSLIGTFAVMAAMGFTLNNLTLFGLVLAIGIVVDDAIVVLENIERQIATGLDARTATIKAMEEITGPILAITLVLSSVFIPCCFLGGITGQFFRQFAVTIAVSTIISAINALTMTPSRAVLIFKTEEGGDGHELKREALPWWIFGILGGLLTVWLGDESLAARLGLPRRQAERTCRRGCRGLHRRAVFHARRARRRRARLVHHPAGERRAGLVLPRLQPLLRPGDRASTAGWSAACCGSARSCCSLYGGLLVLTYWQFIRTPTGLHPAAGQGLPDPQRAAARLRLGRADAAGHGPHRDSWPATRRASSTRSASPASR